MLSLRLRELRPVGLLLAGGLALCGPGCLIHEQLVPPNEAVHIKGQAPIPVNNEPLTKANEDGKPKTLKASTCVAHADYLKSCGDLATQRSEKADSEQHRRLLKNQATTQFAQARQRYEQALQIDAKEMSAHLGLARLAVAEGNLPEAQRQYQELLKSKSNSALVWHELGMLNAKQKNWEQALQQLGKAVELEPRNATYCSNYAWTLARAERFEEAWNAFRPQVGEAQAYYRLAQMTNHLGKPDLTRAYLTYALQRDPALIQAQEMMASLDGSNLKSAVVPADGQQPTAVQPTAVQPTGQ